MADPFEPDLSILENYDDEDANTPLVKHLRAELKRLGKAGKTAEENGRKAASQEFEQRQARQSALADVPSALHGLFADVDPTDQGAKKTKLEQLQAAGITWGQSGEVPPPPAHEAPDLSLDRMQQAAAGGQSPGNEAGDRAQRIQRDLTAGRSISDEDVDWFSGTDGYTNTLIREAGKRPGM